MAKNILFFNVIALTCNQWGDLFVNPEMNQYIHL